VPVGIAHEGANRHDQKLLAETLGSIPIERPKPTPQTPHGLCLDRAYDAPAMHELVHRARAHAPYPHARRGDRRQAAHARVARPPLGGRGLPLVAEPKPRHPHPLVQKGPQPPRPAPTRLRPDRLQKSASGPTRRPTGIGPKSLPRVAAGLRGPPPPTPSRRRASETDRKPPLRPAAIYWPPGRGGPPLEGPCSDRRFHVQAVVCADAHETPAADESRASRLYERGRLVKCGSVRWVQGPRAGWWWRAALKSLSPLWVGDRAEWEVRSGGAIPK
jgi:hypothetical protein